VLVLSKLHAAPMKPGPCTFAKHSSVSHWMLQPSFRLMKNNEVGKNGAGLRAELRNERSGPSGQERRVGPAPTTPFGSQHAQPQRKEGVATC
jgi:hypothetical protein